MFVISLTPTWLYHTTLHLGIGLCDRLAKGRVRRVEEQKLLRSAWRAKRRVAAVNHAVIQISVVEHRAYSVVVDRV
jgi:hypothetical protein